MRSNRMRPLWAALSMAGAAVAQSGKSSLVIAIGLLEPIGIGRTRLRRFAAVSSARLIPFVEDAADPRSAVRSGAWKGYSGLSTRNDRHQRLNSSASGDPVRIAMPCIHRVAALLKRWPLRTHQGSEFAAHLDEFAFGFSGRESHRRGILFEGLLEDTVVTKRTRYPLTQEWRVRGPFDNYY